MKDISLHLLDIIENAVNAGADHIHIHMQINAQRLQFKISDNGCGMSEEMLTQLQNPFFTSRTTRKVGLGIPLLIQNTEQTGGGVKIKSQIKEGTTIEAEFISAHIDCPPMGDCADVLINLIASYPSILFEFILESESNNFVIDSTMIKEVFTSDIALNPEVVQELKIFLRSNIDNVINHIK